jgi:hypothetical protein
MVWSNLVDINPYVSAIAIELEIIWKRFKVLDDRFGIHKVGEGIKLFLFLWEQCSVAGIIDRHEDHQFEFIF